LWLEGTGRSLYDTFGFEWTLLRLGTSATDVQPFRAIAASIGIDLTIVDVAGPEARELYGADLALIRPDQIVAWRGGSASKALAVLSQVCGRTEPS
jgi:hypothetical protein